MTTTAEDPFPQTRTPDAPVIDVELGGAVRPRRAERSRAFGEPRRTKVTIRRFGLVSVFRYSLLFSFCMMLVLWLALLIIFLALQAAGVTDTMAQWIGCLVKPDQTPAARNGGVTRPRAARRLNDPSARHASIVPPDPRHP